jgi:hypothetical protein
VDVKGRLNLPAPVYLLRIKLQRELSGILQQITKQKPSLRNASDVELGKKNKEKRKRRRWRKTRLRASLS